MKKLKNLLTLSVLAVCLAGMVFAFGSSAEGASKPEIISKNVKYTDKFILMYAVDAATVDGGEATLKVYETYPAEMSNPICTLKDTTTETIKKADGTAYECYVFTTNGISATEFTTNYYVTVTDGDGNVSDVARYSVAEYLNERLYKNGIASVTEGDDAVRKDFYLSTLAFGANAEKVLYNLDSDTENDREYLVTDYKYIYTDLGTIDGSFSAGVYAPGTALTFTAADSTKRYKTTEILAGGADGNGTAIAADGSFTVEATSRIDFKAYERGEGKYWNEVGNSITTGYLAYNFDNEGAALNGFGGNVSGDTTFANGSNIDGAATLTRIANSWATAHFYYTRINSEFPGDVTSATCKVFEFDYKISDMFSGSNDGRSLFRLDGGDYIKGYRNSDGTTLSLGAKDTATITPGEWCNIRFEFYKVSGAKYVQIYVNDTYAYTQTLTDTTNTFNNRIYFYLEAATSVGTTVCVDNFVMAFITKDYVANP